MPKIDTDDMGNKVQLWSATSGSQHAIITYAISNESFFSLKLWSDNLFAPDGEPFVMEFEEKDAMGIGTVANHFRSHAAEHGFIGIMNEMKGLEKELKIEVTKCAASIAVTAMAALSRNAIFNSPLSGENLAAIISAKNEVEALHKKLFPET